jgi:hypothetical protein
MGFKEELDILDREIKEERDGIIATSKEAYSNMVLESGIVTESTDLPKKNNRFGRRAIVIGSAIILGAAGALGVAYEARSAEPGNVIKPIHSGDIIFPTQTPFSDKNPTVTIPPSSKP